jgi:translation initiation factor 6
VILPNITTPEEVAALKALGLNVYHSKEKSNAHGNNLSVSDKGGLLNPHISRVECKRMEDALGVELVQMHIAKYSTVGSASLPGNKGFLIHYAASDEELKLASGAFKVGGDRGTVNMGTGFVSFGIVANSKGYVSGEATSAFEVGRAEAALGFI